MIKELINYLKDKKILILGFGLEGQSTYKFIREYLKEKTIHISDKEENFEKKSELLKQDKNVICISGEKYLDNLEKYDVNNKSTRNIFHELRHKQIHK